MQWPEYPHLTTAGVFARLERDAEQGGSFMNPDELRDRCAAAGLKRGSDKHPDNLAPPPLRRRTQAGGPSVGASPGGRSPGVNPVDPAPLLDAGPSKGTTRRRK